VLYIPFLHQRHLHQVASWSTHLSASPLFVLFCVAFVMQVCPFHCIPCSNSRQNLLASPPRPRPHDPLYSLAHPAFFTVTQPDFRQVFHVCDTCVLAVSLARVASIFMVDISVSFTSFPIFVCELDATILRQFDIETVCISETCEFPCWSILS